MRNVGYFTSWSIYDRKYLPSQIPANVLTHVLYAFANIRPDSGQVYLTDAWADEQIHHDGEPWDDYGRPLLYGNFKALLKLKQEHRHLKVLLSIGGWTHSSNFAQAAATQAGRDTFATSSVKLLEEYALDGLDVDWEFPKNDGEAQDYVDLLRTCRLALDAHARRKGESVPYELTVAAPCGAAQSQQLRIRQMDQYLSFWNLMSYDYSGPWGDKADHQANVLATSTNNGICTDRAVQYYLSQAVRPDKLVIGIPLYGRSFLNCKGPGHSYSGQGQGSWEIGTYDYKALPLQGQQVHHDDRCIASYAHGNGHFITFDTVDVAHRKADWINKRGLGGAMYWELSGDRPANDPAAIVPRIASVLHHQGGGLDTSQNHLSYPDSRFDNVRNR